MAEPFRALILAGSRGGVDPVAAYAGVSHKALIELGGRTLLERVADALLGAGVGGITVSTDDGEVLRVAAELGLEMLPSEAGPSLSVASAFARSGAPLVVTTADHALLEPDWIAQFLADVPSDADVAVLLARRQTIEAAAPGTRRTYLRFANGEWSGCNLFLLATPRAASAIELWRMVEADRKRPWRIVRRFGLGMLVSYLAGRLTLSKAVARLGETAHVKAAVVESRYGLAAVDVDKPADLDLVRGLVAGNRPDGALDRETAQR